MQIFGGDLRQIYLIAHCLCDLCCGFYLRYQRVHNQTIGGGAQTINTIIVACILTVFCVPRIFWVKLWFALNPVVIGELTLSVPMTQSYVFTCTIVDCQ